MDKKIFYNNSEAYYEALQNETEDYYSEFIALVRYNLKNKNIKIFDLGCGLGQSTFLLNQSGYDVTGFDYSHRFISHARARYKNIKFIQGEAQKVNFSDASFDAAVSYNTIEHLNNLDLCLAELIRITKPGGLIIIQAPNLLSPEYPFSAFKNSGQTYEGKKNLLELAAMFFRNIFWLAKKRVKRQFSLTYRQPIFDFSCNDNDAASYLNPYDLKLFFTGHGCEIVGYQQVDHLNSVSMFKKIASLCLPDFMGIIRIVARKK